MPGELAVEFKDVYEAYDLEIKTEGKTFHERFEALKGVSFTVGKGECLAIIGPNGAGKSTILRLLAGLLTPEKGEVKASGRVSSLLDLGAGFHTELTGRDNLLLNASLYNFSREEIVAKQEEILAFAAIGKFVDAPVRCYSQGMYVRLAFSLAIHVDPQILLIDDCLAVGDDEFRVKSFDKVLEMKERGKTIIFVTHDFGAAKQLCVRGIYLKEGRVVRDGDIGEVIASYVKPLKVDKERYKFLGEKISEDEEIRKKQEEEQRRIREENLRKEFAERLRADEETWREKEVLRRQEATSGWTRQEEKRRKEESEAWNKREEERRQKDAEGWTRQEEERRKAESESWNQKEGERRKAETERWERELEEWDKEEKRRKEESEAWNKKEAERRRLETESWKRKEETRQKSESEKWNSQEEKRRLKEIELWDSEEAARRKSLMDAREREDEERRQKEARDWECWREQETERRRQERKKWDLLEAKRREIDREKERARWDQEEMVRRQALVAEWSRQEEMRRRADGEAWDQKESARREALVAEWSRQEVARRKAESEAWNALEEQRRKMHGRAADTKEERPAPKKIREAAPVTLLGNGGLRLDIAPCRVRIFDRECELTRDEGLRVVFLKGDVDVSSSVASWRIRKISDSGVICFLKWPKPIGIMQVWRFTVISGGTIDLTIESRARDFLSTNNERTECCLRSGGSILGEEVWGNKGKLFSLGKSGIKLETFDDDKVCEISPRGPYFLTVRDNEEKIPAAKKQRRFYFRGRFLTGVKKPESPRGTPPVQKLGPGRLQALFRQGACQLTWKQKPLTVGFGLYTSLFSQGMWFDSTRAIWRVEEHSKDRLIVKGHWPWLPVAQTWEIFFENEKSLLFSVGMRISKDTSVHLQETALMLSEAYKRWRADKEAQEFPKEFTADDFFRICPWGTVSDGKRNVSALSRDLPGIMFRPASLPGHRLVVENAGHIKDTSCRLFHCLRANKGAKAIFAAGDYEFFKGTITVNEEEKL
ncbi:MAG: ATP-binding cassette domain-containing protein [Candidatus Omnitrophica bacterium]|nr:ATP-binding cassette domain-containing protein [Candidatus Omnitrophota bacterium]